MNTQGGLLHRVTATFFFLRRWRASTNIIYTLEILSKVANKHAFSGAEPSGPPIKQSETISQLINFYSWIYVSCRLDSIWGESSAEWNMFELNLDQLITQPKIVHSYHYVHHLNSWITFYRYFYGHPDWIILWLTIKKWLYLSIISS